MNDKWNYPTMNKKEKKIILDYFPNYSKWVTNLNWISYIHSSSTKYNRYNCTKNMNNHSCYNGNFCLNWYYISHELGIYTYMCAWNVLCKFYKRYSYSICLSTMYHSGLLGYGRPFRIFLLLYFGTRLGFRNKKCLRFALMYIVHCTIHSWESDEDVKPSLNCLFILSQV